MLQDRCKITNNKEFSILSQVSTGQKKYDVDVDLDDEECGMDIENKFRATTLHELRFKAQDVFYA